MIVGWVQNLPVRSHSDMMFDTERRHNVRQLAYDFIARDIYVSRYLRIHLSATGFGLSFHQSKITKIMMEY